MTQPTTKHPKGLYVLFFTEMWERFGFYLIIGIFSLYMIDSWDNGGMGFDKLKKSDIYGTYIGLVYLTPFIGGLLADRIFGYRKSIIAGGLLMSAGYFGLALHTETSFYISLLLIILGNGMFKPNISTLVGNLYNNDQYKANKDAGYNIFYMGINVGAFLCNFVASFLRLNFGWGFAFAAAGAGMLIGLIIFILGTKHIKEADVIKPVKPEDMGTSKILLSTIVPMFIFGVLGYVIPGNIFGTDTNDAFIVGCIPIIAFFIYLSFTAPKEDRRPISALLAVYACIVVFWAIFHQNGDALTIWAEENTDREMPALIAGPASTLKLAQTVTNLGDSTNAKSALYFENLSPDKIPTKGESLKLFSTELYQSINPFWVIMLTPIVVGFWGWLRRKKKEPSTPTKIAIGLVITALSALVMVGAVEATNHLETKASSLWLLASYGVITIGELCLSPMGLSLVSKLSPPRITALMMGGFFLSTSFGNKLSGILSGTWERFENKTHFFYMNFALVMVAAVSLFLMLKWINGVMKEKNIY